jgi:DNA-binding LacI/PurR family transcriptional regulator
MGELAARLLLERLAAGPGEREEFSEFRVGTRLIERDSCRTLPGRLPEPEAQVDHER